jgi:hypothetical protein
MVTPPRDVVPVVLPADPVTAGLIVLNGLIELIREVIKSQPPDVAAALWRMHVEDVREWRAFLKKLAHDPDPAGPVATPMKAKPRR